MFVVIWFASIFEFKICSTLIAQSRKYEREKTVQAIVEYCNAQNEDETQQPIKERNKETRSKNRHK